MPETTATHIGHTLRRLAIALTCALSLVAPCEAATATSTTKVLSATGSTGWVPIQGRNGNASDLLPSFLVSLSPGAQLTYTVEVTGDQPNGADVFPTVPTVVVPFSADSTAQNASGLWNLAGTVTGVRLTITSWTSGSATLQVVQ